MASDLHDAFLLCFSDELLFELQVLVLDSEDHVDSGFVVVVCDLRPVVTVRLVDAVPEHPASLIGKLDVIIETAHLVHVRAVQTCHVHREDCRCIVVSVRTLLEGIPVAEDGSVLDLLSNEVLSHDDNGAASCSEVLLSTHIYDSKFLPWNIACSNI